MSYIEKLFGPPVKSTVAKHSAPDRHEMVYVTLACGHVYAYADGFAPPIGSKINCVRCRRNNSPENS